MLHRLLIALLLLVATPALAADPAGSWAFRAGGATLFRFELRHAPAGWQGVWVRPQDFESDGDTFSKVRGPVVRRQAIAARETDGAVELTFDDPRPNATPDIFRFRLLDADRVEARYIGSGFDPLLLVRDLVDAPLGPWRPDRDYVRIVERPTNAEMTAIFDADQAIRHNWDKHDPHVIAKTDHTRRLRTQALLDSGALQSGEDYYHAAFVFQHGNASGDYLKAHLLATIAVARGKPAATWIAAATLDRYLQSIGQPQVLGTQYNIPDTGIATQAPYDRTLLSDALRQAMRVPTIAEQEARRHQLDRPAAAAKQ